MGSSFITYEIKIDTGKCTGCGTCAENCPMGVLEMATVGRKKLSKVKNPDMCVGCHTCELRCPYEAIKVYPPLGKEFG